MTLTLDLNNLLDPSRVLTRSIDRYAHASDASFYRLIPRAVVLPDSLDEIRRLFAYSRSQQIPLVFRAAGTSLSGQSITDGILVDLSRYWNKLLVENDGQTVRLQPGVIGSHANRALKPFGRRIGPDPASIDACMIGGILSNNASGMCCGVQENSYHTLRSLTFMLPDGSVFDTSAEGENQRFVNEQPGLARELLSLRQQITTSPELFDRIRSRYKTKNTTGYSLNAFIDHTEPLQILAHLLVGAEGTLGFIAEAVLNTLPDYKKKYTGLLYFHDVHTAGRAIVPLSESGARAIEIFDRAAIRSIEQLDGAPKDLRDLPGGAAAILVEYQCQTEVELTFYIQAAGSVCASLDLMSPPIFTQDQLEQANLWKLRKGIFPAIGALRPQGTSVIIEDVAFPVDRLADAILDLQLLFKKFEYPEGIVYGHAKDGNLHFVVTQSFNDETSIQRYAAFMDDLVHLVVDRYDGALKAEHGTGRNVAPFVAAEWGREAYAIMSALKNVIDPFYLLNPGVIINPDPLAHVTNLKNLPVIESEVDPCIECGFCELNCPSRHLTLTPRQRIVLRREFARQRNSSSNSELLLEMEHDYNYSGLDTCAVDGLCASACPVYINTGTLIKHLRADNASETARSIAIHVERNFSLVESCIRAGIGLAHAAENVVGAKFIAGISQQAERLIGTRLPRWNAAVPHRTKHLAFTASNVAQIVYFPSCLSRTMGGPALDKNSPSLNEIFTRLCERAEINVHVPVESHGLCCGMPFSSKGYTKAFQEMLHKTLKQMWSWSKEGRLPVVIDASSCAYTLRTADTGLDGEDLILWKKLTILDSVEFARDWLLPKLKVNTLPETVILHPNCALRKLNLDTSLRVVVQACVDTVVIPENLGCCGFAGDRGLLFPELTQSAAQQEKEEVLLRSYDGYYSSNLTCEMGMALATGKPYRSFLYLLEKASR